MRETTQEKRDGEAKRRKSQYQSEMECVEEGDEKYIFPGYSHHAGSLSAVAFIRCSRNHI